MTRRWLYSVSIALLLMAGVSVAMLGTGLLSFEIADTIGSTWIHRNSLISLAFSVITCCVELVVTAMSYERVSKSLVLGWSAAICSAYGIMWIFNCDGAWAAVVCIACMVWNCALFVARDRKRTG